MINKQRDSIKWNEQWTMEETEFYKGQVLSRATKIFGIVGHPPTPPLGSVWFLIAVKDDNARETLAHLAGHTIAPPPATYLDLPTICLNSRIKAQQGFPGSFWISSDIKSQLEGSGHFLEIVKSLEIKGVEVLKGG